MAKIYIFGVPQHNNLGDHAIAQATKDFIKDHTKLKIIEIPTDQSIDCVDEVKKQLTPEDIIAWHGGGNVGTLWPKEEKVRLNVLKEFADHKIVSFPQSIFFEPHKERLLERSKATSKGMSDATLFLREQVSYDLAKQNYTHIQNLLVPDMVFSLQCRFKRTNRNGSIVLLRSDKEQRLKQQKQITTFLEDTFTRVTKSDMVAKENIQDLRQRKKVIKNKLNEIAAHQLVVTDRLHGMIFAYITGTPCVVFENSYHKIRSTYDTWLKDCKYIELVESVSDLESKIETVLANVDKPHEIETAAYAPLIDVLRAG